MTISNLAPRALTWINGPHRRPMSALGHVWTASELLLATFEGGPWEDAMVEIIRPPHPNIAHAIGMRFNYRIFSQIRSFASPGTNRPSAPVASSFGSAPPTISRRIFSI